MDLRSLLRRMRAEFGERTCAHARARRTLDGRAAAILMYHRVLPRVEITARNVEPGMVVTPETFARHLGWLQKHFRVLPLVDIVACFESGRSLPPRACAITFDDGWRDNHTHAYPALVRLGLPATIFLVAGRVGSRGAFWPDEACQRWARVPAIERKELARILGLAVAGSAPTDLVSALKPLGETERERRLDMLRAHTPEPPDTSRQLLDWREIDEMARAGIAFESHGMSHAILTGLPAAGAERELRDARAALTERGHGVGGLLAYPSGEFNAAVCGLARSVGYRAAVSTERRIARGADDRFRLPRLGLHEDVSASQAEFHRLIPGNR